jgi:hypothetical protein
MKKNLSI